MIRCTCAALAATVLVLSATRAEEWPEFRGPTGQGIAQDQRLPVEWSNTRNVVWKQSIPGTGWSSPVVVKGRIFLTTSVAVAGNGDQSLRTLCLDARKGTVVWNKEIFRQQRAMAPGIHSKNSHASPTLLVYDQRLYVHFGHQGTACLDLTGKVLWRNNQIKYAPVHGNGGSPILVDNALVFSCDGGDRAFVIALDRKNGKVLWKTDRSVPAGKKFSFSTPLLITVRGQKQIISPGSNMVGAYNPRSGGEIWRVSYDGYSVIPRPVFGQGLVFISTGYNTPVLLAIRPDGKGDVTETHVAWTMRRAAPHTPSPLLVDKDLYTVSDRGVASCLDAKTGKVHWQKRLGGDYSASPMYGDGKVYFQSEEGVGTVVKEGKEFKQLAKNAMDESTLASYAVADGALFLRTKTKLCRIQKK